MSKLKTRALTFSRFPVRVKDPFVSLGRVPVLQGNNPPPNKGLNHVCCYKPGCPELLNTHDMFLHPLGNFRDGPPFFVGHEVGRPPLDRALFVELDVEPFLWYPFQEVLIGKIILSSTFQNEKPTNPMTNFLE